MCRVNEFFIIYGRKPRQFSTPQYYPRKENSTNFSKFPIKSSGGDVFGGGHNKKNAAAKYKYPDFLTICDDSFPSASIDKYHRCREMHKQAMKYMPAVLK